MYTQRLTQLLKLISRGARRVATARVPVFGIFQNAASRAHAGGGFFFDIKGHAPHVTAPRGMQGWMSPFPAGSSAHDDHLRRDGEKFQGNVGAVDWT